MRSYINIHLNKIKENLEFIKAKNNKQIIAVIKSNSYGLGIVEIAKYLSSLMIDFFAVSTLEEAILLRKNHIKGNILVLESNNNYLEYIKHNLTYTLYSLDSLKDIIKLKQNIKIHIKINTGLNRLGIEEHEIDELINLTSPSFIKIEGIFSHIADSSTYEKQYATFNKVINKLNHLNFKYIHLDSSRFMNKENSYTHIRIGISLYSSKEDSLELLSPIIRIKDVKKDELVGYHNQEKTPSKGYLITIPLGYADGWNSSRRTLGYIEGNIIQQIGETCMDHMMFFSKNKIKSPTIELIGDNLNLTYLSKIYGESKYEILSSLSTRLKRNYFK